MDNYIQAMMVIAYGWIAWRCAQVAQWSRWTWLLRGVALHLFVITIRYGTRWLTRLQLRGRGETYTA